MCVGGAGTSIAEESANSGPLFGVDIVGEGNYLRGVVVLRVDIVLSLRGVVEYRKEVVGESHSRGCCRR